MILASSLPPGQSRLVPPLRVKLRLRRLVTPCYSSLSPSLKGPIPWVEFRVHFLSAFNTLQEVRLHLLLISPGCLWPTQQQVPPGLSIGFCINQEYQPPFSPLFVCNILFYLSPMFPEGDVKHLGTKNRCRSRNPAISRLLFPLEKTLPGPGGIVRRRKNGTQRMRWPDEHHFWWT